MLGWDRYGFNKNGAETCYAELFLHPVGSTGHVVHSGASGARNVDALFFVIGWTDAVSIKSAPGHVTLNLCSCIGLDLLSHPKISNFRM
jgi:hypothetical protein